MIIIPDTMRRPAELRRDELEKEVAELRVMVLKMRNCGNCRHSVGGETCLNLDCTIFQKWEPIP
jgi:hypothetical protein